MKWIQKKSLLNYKKSDLLINKLSAIRGVENINEWVNPPSKFLHSPYLLKNIDEAVTRIIKAVHMGERIVIVADIDTDGVCSTGIMYNFLKVLTDNVVYIHAQRSDGHGVEKVMGQIDEESSLIIIVDSSSNSFEGCKELVDQGKDVIIIDHHEIDVENPYATIVNCQMDGYPNPALSGSAMAYKVCQVLDEYLDLENADYLLDLCSIGLVGDMMDMKNMENRYLVYNGINYIENIGIREILKQSKIDYSEGITTTNISFKIAPIIGACSRFNKIELALELVTTDDEERAKVLTKQMIEMNEKRKSEQKSTVEDLVNGLDDSNNLIVIVNNEIDSGFRGLVATEVVEQYSKPVFVLSEIYNDNGDVVAYGGSARSVGLIPLKEMCQKSSLFNFATGHSQAHGVEFPQKNFSKIISYFNENLDSEDLQHVVEYDIELHVDEIDDFDIKDIEKFSQIVGQGFPEPKFKINGIVVEEGQSKKLGTYVRAILGANKDTVKIHAENEFVLMKFRSNEEFASDIEEHFHDNFSTELTVVGSLNLNKFYNWGTRSLDVTKQVFLSDYKIVE